MPLDFVSFTTDSAGSVRAARFAPACGGTEEFHLCVEAALLPSFEEQLASLQSAHERALGELGLGPDTAVFRRVFLSDAANQEERVRASGFGDTHASTVATSIIEQQPAGGRKVALWAYHVRDAEPLKKRHVPRGLMLERRALAHVWTTGVEDTEFASAYEQTRGALESYSAELSSLGASLRDDVVRTWFFVNDIDAEYGGLVEARKHLFEEVGLTPTTHFIASTGIAGRRANPGGRISLDAYAVRGLRASQVKYLTAPLHLGPTHLYGVTFERGTRIAYADRCHVFVSGTASIDPSGATLHVGDVVRQCERALDNTEALLGDAGATLDQVAQMIAYVRDAADSGAVEAFLASRLPNVPRVVVRAPVCRPNWLVEFECLAMTRNQEATHPEF